MKNTVLSIITRITNCGVNSSTPRGLEKKIHLTNQLALATSLLILMLDCWLYALSFQNLAIFMSVSIFFIIRFVLWMNQKEQYTYARLNFIVIVHLIFLVLYLYVGSNSGLYIIFMHLVCMPILLFEFREKKNLIIGTSISIFVCLFSHFYLWIVGPYLVLEDSTQTVLYVSSWLIGYITIAFIIYYLYFENFKSEQKLIEKKQELLELNESVRKAQIQLAQSEKMSALGEMAGGVAHEINSPLAAVSNLSNQVDEILQEANPDFEMIGIMNQKIEKTTARIAKITKGLRTFSRDGSDDDFQMINVKSLLESIPSLCQEKLNAGKISLQMDPISPDCQFSGRETEISQVLVNIIGNACDAITTLPVTPKWIQISVSDQPEQVEISITDCGSGIPIELKDKIFQPFFTTKEIGKGTGLGLSISIGIIHVHHGEIYLDSQCKNTKFVIRVPKQQPKTA